MEPKPFSLAAALYSDESKAILIAVNDALFILDIAGYKSSLPLPCLSIKPPSDNFDFRYSYQVLRAAFTASALEVYLHSPHSGSIERDRIYELSDR